MAHSSSNKSRPMSIDAMLDMERKEVLALLENQTNTSTERVRSASPYAVPRSPVRSLLDIAEEPTTSTRTAPGTQAPVRSMLDVDSPPSSPPPVVRRSMLDVDAPPTAAKQSGTRTQPNSPTLPTASLATSGTVSRSKSDAGLKPVEFGPRALAGSRGGDPTSGYQFSHIYTANSGQQLPKRTSQPPKRQSVSAMAETLRNSDLSGLHFPGESGRHGTSSNRFGNKSKSPHNRLSNRSRSPATFSPQLPPGKVMLGTGQIVDINNAYRRLSDANLAISSGSLAQLPMRKRSSEAGEGRLIKDYLGPDGEHLGSSDEDDDPFTSDDEDRGRNKSPRPISPDSTADSTADGKSPSQSYKSGRQTLSLLAAAEEERHHVASQQPKYQYKSLIPEPEIKVTNSSGDTVKPSKTKVHPNTSYDQGPGSATPSVVDSDEEADMDDIKRAQKLSFSMTNVLSAPGTHRAIRIIYRGDYTKIAQAAEEEHHRLRKYLVATDLSDESTHALEWAIGTVLRDGDTLIAIYCVDEDTGIVSGDAGLVPDDPKSMKEQAAALASVSSVSDFRRATAFALRSDSSTPGTPSGSPAPTGRGERSKGDEERHRAVKDITDRVLKLLRKTRLQVRVIVEVLHCKNPKHLITEVIDLINPTLVVIGSRGRSALKGVILGSFSNYLVTKSSVPVMVARKRLRKQSKYKRTAVRQVNNLSNPTARSLAMAKID